MSNLIIAKSNYKLLIQHYLQETDPPAVVEQKIQKITDHLLLNPNSKIKIENQEAILLIFNLLQTKPGRALFSNLIQADQELVIANNTTKSRNYYSPSTHTLYIHTNPQSVGYKVLLDVHGQHRLVKTPREISVAHEALHALHYFFQSNQSTKREWLLIDPDLNSKEEQQTILGTAEAKENYQTQEIDYLCENSFLIAYGYDPRITHTGIHLPQEQTVTLLDAIYFGADGDIAEILDHNPSLINLPQTSCFLNQKYPSLAGQKLSPLAMAAIAGRAEIFNALLQRGADPYLIDEQGTLLHVAVKGRYPNLSIINTLTETYHFNINVTDKKGDTPLTLLIKKIAAAEKSHFKSYNTLQKTQLYSALRNLAEKARLTPFKPDPSPLLIQAILCKTISSFIILVQCGFDIHCTDSSDNTPLLLAIKKHIPNDKIEKILSLPGIDINRQNLLGETALSLAIQEKNIELVQLLIAHGSTVSQKLTKKLLSPLAADDPLSDNNNNTHNPSTPPLPCSP